MSERIAVLQNDIDREGVVVARIPPGKALRMVALGQAHWLRRGRTLRLAHHTDLPMDGGRTRTSRGGMLAAIGRSQSYTTREISPQSVSGFKSIYPEDRHVFALATIEACGRVAL